MSHVMMLPNGSAGDVLPYVWLGRQLIQRGHVVTMACWEQFREVAEHAGLHFVALEEMGSKQKWHPSAWDPGKGMRIGHEHAGHCTPKFVAAAQKIMTRH